MSKQSSSSSKGQWTTELATALILLYENYPCLYKVKAKEYHNRNFRNKAYQEICESLTNLFPENKCITEGMIKAKIHTLRTQFTAELNQIKKSELSGVSPDEVYRPTLWCFEMLQFLQDTELVVQGESTMETGLGNVGTESPEELTENEVIFDGTVGDISQPLSVESSSEIDMPCTSASANLKTPKRKHKPEYSDSQSVYKKRETPTLKRRKEEDRQLFDVLDTASKAMSHLVDTKNEEKVVVDTSRHLDFTRFLGAEMEKIGDEELLDELKTEIIQSVMNAKKKYRRNQENNPNKNVC